MATSITGKIARKYMAHYVDASFGGQTANYVRIGKDLEEYNVEMNPDTELKKNILGETSFTHNGYEISGTAEPFYAVVGDPLFTQLQTIIDTQANDDTCKTTVVEAHLWDGTSPSFTAYKQDAYIVPTSYGGDTSGYQIPFTINYVGTKVAGTFNVTTSAFTPASP